MAITGRACRRSLMARSIYEAGFAAYIGLHPLSLGASGIVSLAGGRQVLVSGRRGGLRCRREDQRRCRSCRSEPARLPDIVRASISPSRG